jgi:predicted GNAT family acetyltransferase
MHPLDTLIWSALTGVQASFAEGEGMARRMRAEIGPFAAAADRSAAAVAALVALVPAHSDISLLEPVPPSPRTGVACALERACVQMVAADVRPQTHEAEIIALGDADAAEMLALALLTKPGPFRAETHKLGRFIGVRDQGKLIAMAGERLRIDGFIEVSAVCTHPDYRGRGLGAALLSRVAARIVRDGATPFLHSYADNDGAIALYRKLGFQVRGPIVHAVWRRT